MANNGGKQDLQISASDLTEEHDRVGAQDSCHLN